MVLAPQTTVTSELSVREGKGKYLTVFDGAEQKENQLMLKEENIHYIDNHINHGYFHNFYFSQTTFCTEFFRNTHTEANHAARW